MVLSKLILEKYLNNRFVAGEVQGREEGRNVGRKVGKRPARNGKPGITAWWKLRERGEEFNEPLPVFDRRQGKE